MLDSIEQQNHASDALARAGEEQEEGNVEIHAPTPANDPSRRIELQRTVEQCFMMDGPSKYTCLLNRVDSEFYIPVEDLLLLDPVKPLTDDIGLLLDALRGSKLLQLSEDEMFMRPSITLERNVIILRDIDSELDPKIVLEIFNDAPGLLVSLRSDIGNMWFATFESEEECTQTLMFIRSRSFQNNPIKCGIKSGSVFGNFFAAASMQLEQAYQQANVMYGSDYYGYDYNDRRGGRFSSSRRRNKTAPSSGKSFRKRFQKLRRDSVPALGSRPDGEPAAPIQVSLTADDFPALSSVSSENGISPNSHSVSRKAPMVDIVKRMSGERISLVDPTPKKAMSSLAGAFSEELDRHVRSESQITSENEQTILSDCEGTELHHGRIPGTLKKFSSSTSTSSRKDSEPDLNAHLVSESIASEPCFEAKDLQSDVLVRPSSAPPSEPVSRSAWGSSSISYAAILKRAKSGSVADASSLDTQTKGTSPQAKLSRNEPASVSNRDA